MIGILVAFSFFPIPGNYKIYTVLSGSMEPAIHTGSLIFVKSQENYNEGDIITVPTSDGRATVTHRVISKAEKDGEVTFKTKGDANDGEDREVIEEDSIIGKTFLAIPLLGYPVNYAKTPQGLILLIIIPAIIIIYDEVRKIEKEIGKKIDYWKRVKKRKENKKENSENEGEAEKEKDNSVDNNEE